MNNEEIYELMNQNPSFFLATTENNIPFVRGMLLYRADKDGIIFHSSVSKDVYRHLKQNPNAELCFTSGMTQLRVSGIVTIENSKALTDQIMGHPSRKFLSDWKDSFSGDDFYNEFVVFRMKGGKATLWNLATNLLPKEFVTL